MRPKAIVSVCLACALALAAEGGARAAPPAPADAKAPVDDAKADEVRVTAPRAEPGRASLKAEDTRRMPGAFGDAFRALEAMPGVTPFASGVPYFFVRGAPPGNTGYFLDGVRVPLLFHVGVGPGVVHPGLVDRVDFYSGGYPARFGRFTGGVVSAETTPPPSAPHAQGTVRLFDAGGLVASPFAGGRGSVVAAARYSYTAALLSLVASDTRLAYWDYQLRATWDASSRDRVSVFAFGSYDDLSSRETRGDAFSPVFGADFHRVDLRYDRALSRGGKLRAAITLGVDRTRLGADASRAYREERTLSSALAQARVEYEARLSDAVRVRAGADAIFEGFDADVRVRPRSTAGETDPSRGAADDVVSDLSPLDGRALAALSTPRSEQTAGVRGDVAWRPSPRVELTLGARVDVFVARPSDDARIAPAVRARAAGTRAAFDPRLSARVSLTRAVSLVSTFGLAHQPPSLVVSAPGVRPSALASGLQTAVQASEGVEARLPFGVAASLTAFVHNYLGLTDVTATCGTFDDAGDVGACTDRRVRGRAVGLELSVRRDFTHRLSGFVAYTLSRATRTTKPVRFIDALPRLPESEMRSEFDRPHVLNAALGYDLGRGVHAGARVVVYSGRPYTKTFAGYPLPPYNSARMPPFARLDVRLEKAFAVGRSGGRVSVVAEGLNVTLSKEAVDVVCESDARDGPPVAYVDMPPDGCRFKRIGPVAVPSLGVEGVF